MNQELFWNWLKNIKKKHPDCNRIGVRTEFDSLHKDPRLLISASYQKLWEAGDMMELWEAGSLLSGTRLGDDSFSHFRNWLLWQGETAFNASLDDPDSIISLVNGSHTSPFCESLDVCRPAVQPGDHQATYIRLWNWQDSSTETIAKRLPRLWSRFGSKFNWSPTLKVAVSFEAPGLGQLEVGSRLFHKAGLGKGEIVEVISQTSAIARIRYSSEEKVMRVTSDFFKCDT